jgi:hypothetical protein
MSRNDEEKAVSAVSFISSSLWYIEDFSITNERKITRIHPFHNVTVFQIPEKG